MRPFPARLLGDDEEVVLDLRPHVRRIAVALALVPVVAGVTSYVVFVVPDGAWRRPLRIAVLVVAALVLARWTLRPVLQWAATRYVVTTERVMFRWGVLRRRGHDIPLWRVDDVSFDRTVVDRALGCGTLVIESGGEQGDVVLTDVPHVERVQREVHRLAEQRARRAGGASAR